MVKWVETCRIGVVRAMKDKRVSSGRIDQRSGWSLI